MHVVHPTNPYKPGNVYKPSKKLKFTDPVNLELPKLSIPLIYIDSKPYLLCKHLAQIWNFPSSFQLIKAIQKGTKVPKNQFLNYTTEELNQQLLQNNAITSEDLKFKLTYVDAYWINSFLHTELQSAIEDDDDEEAFTTLTKRSSRQAPALEDDQNITISQVFPQYGAIDSSTEFTHAAFNSLTNVTKYNYYQTSTSLQKYLPPTKMNMTETELIMKETDFGDIEIPKLASSGDTKKPEIQVKRKSISRSKKYNTMIDPNSIDLTESLIPGQGFIPEFNVNHLCKVPNYYISSATSQSSSGSTPTSKKSSMSSLFKSSASLDINTPKLSKHVQQLVASSEGNDTTSLSRYYYTMSYRGPGSGNYKDAALINKLNKIPVTSVQKIISNQPHVNAKVLKRKARSNRSSLSVRGFVTEAFSKSAVNETLNKHRSQMQDYQNLEMLHNSLQFNVLLNSYRDIAGNTWKNYYKFKQTDFEQIGMIQRDKKKEQHEKYLQSEYEAQLQEYKKRQQAFQEELQKFHENQKQQQLAGDFSNPDDRPQPPQFTEKPPTPPLIKQPRLSDRFVLPSEVPEILRQLPINLRDDVHNTTELVPSIKEVIDLVTTYPDLNNPQLKTQVEVIKIPNANSIGWDNIKKYRN